ncbi:MAG: hypothetical protein AB2708_08900 [Candidatus Thiodiazotropha taylori]
MRVSFSELHNILENDPFYGIGDYRTLTQIERDQQGFNYKDLETLDPSPEKQYPITKLLIAKIYSENQGNQLFNQFRQRWNFLSIRSVAIKHLIFLWAGMMSLPTYRKDGEPTGWEREDFFDNCIVTESEDCFFIDLNEFETFLGNHQLPLPVSLYPNASYNSFIVNNDTDLALDKFRPTPQGPLFDDDYYPTKFWNTVKLEHRCNGNEWGYKTVFSAVKLITDGDESRKQLSADDRGLISRVSRSQPSWNVRECWQEQSYQVNHYVHFGDFLRWAWDQGYQASHEVTSEWLQESVPGSDSLARIHLLLRIAGFEQSVIIEMIPDNLPPYTSHQWKRLEDLTTTRRHLISTETTNHSDFKRKEQETDALDTDIKSMLGISSFNHITEGGDSQVKNSEVGSPEWRSQNAKNAANARYDQAGGSRERKRKLLDLWATGKYRSRNECAKKECAGLGMSYNTARKALINTPDPKKT